MTYRISFRSNPRLYLLVVIPILVTATVVAIFPVFGVLPGVIGVLVGAYLDYQLVKFLRLQLASMVDVSDQGARCVTSSGESLDFPWESVSHAGICTAKNRHRTVFLYNEQEDRLITIPDSFSELDRLCNELSRYVDLQNYALRPEETVRDRLRTLLNQEEDDEDSDDEE